MIPDIKEIFKTFFLLLLYIPVLIFDNFQEGISGLSEYLHDKLDEDSHETWWN